MLLLAQVHGLVSVLAATSTTKAPAAKSGGGSTFFILLILLALFYFFYLRPRRAKLMARQAEARAASAPPEITAGDTVVTASGIIGRVLSIDGDRASIEIAPDTVAEFERSALGRRLDPLAPPNEGDRWASLVSDESAPTGTGSGDAHDHDHDHDDKDEEGTGGAQ